MRSHGPQRHRCGLAGRDAIPHLEVAGPIQGVGHVPPGLTRGSASVQYREAIFQVAENRLPVRPATGSNRRVVDVVLTGKPGAIVRGAQIDWQAVGLQVVVAVLVCLHAMVVRGFSRQRRRASGTAQVVGADVLAEAHAMIANPVETPVGLQIRRHRHLIRPHVVGEYEDDVGRTDRNCICVRNTSGEQHSHDHENDCPDLHQRILPALRLSHESVRPSRRHKMSKDRGDGAQDVGCRTTKSERCESAIPGRGARASVTRCARPGCLGVVPSGVLMRGRAARHRPCCGATTASMVRLLRPAGAAVHPGTPVAVVVASAALIGACGSSSKSSTASSTTTTVATTTTLAVTTTTSFRSFVTDWCRRVDVTYRADLTNLAHAYKDAVRVLEAGPVEMRPELAALKAVRPALRATAAASALLDTEDFCRDRFEP